MSSIPSMLKQHKKARTKFDVPTLACMSLVTLIKWKGSNVGRVLPLSRTYRVISLNYLGLY